MNLTKLRVQAGVWTGEVTDIGAEPPALAVTHLGAPVPGVEVTQAGDRWIVSVPIPAEALCDGVQTILIADARTGARLEAITLLLGTPLDEDIRAEVALLRAELDLLKRAFRRHCVETMG
ncbi:MAG: hypothetical protein KGI94_04570 [Paracoccaceae bacterium]|nr:hypothetical protein [Paracoccaceae bacterium]MDE3239926.1 hypothetical protein [Paracoccaceae bacterium]